ncbi:MAG: ECF-type sigma factor [Gammaproteobacteria bacterium]|nr:ECF-type sigma factor [Gammaproteobacteria bacterium]MDH5304595.1 ECF-type sigma factor [Gammaproteobacteria bacterium]
MSLSNELQPRDSIASLKQGGSRFGKCGPLAIRESTSTPVVYDELQRMARRLFCSEKNSHTLQPTALVVAVPLP